MRAGELVAEGEVDHLDHLGAGARGGEPLLGRRQHRRGETAIGARDVLEAAEHVARGDQRRPVAGVDEPPTPLVPVEHAAVAERQRRLLERAPMPPRQRARDLLRHVVELGLGQDAAPVVGVDGAHARGDEQAEILARNPPDAVDAGAQVAELAAELAAGLLPRQRREPGRDQQRGRGPGLDLDLGGDRAREVDVERLLDAEQRRDPGDERAHRIVGAAGDAILLGHPPVLEREAVEARQHLDHRGEQRRRGVALVGVADVGVELGRR